MLVALCHHLMLQINDARKQTQHKNGAHVSFAAMPFIKAGHSPSLQSPKGRTLGLLGIWLLLQLLLNANLNSLGFAFIILWMNDHRVALIVRKGYADRMIRMIWCGR